jgi:hypothetical protein
MICSIQKKINVFISEIKLLENNQNMILTIKKQEIKKPTEQKNFINLRAAQ